MTMNFSSASSLWVQVSYFVQGVGLLRKLINYGGKTEAYEIVAEQKARIPRRPALIDELSKLEES